VTRRAPLVVFLNPDGTHHIGDYVLVSAPTGIIYETHCAGYATEQRSAEGFLVSVGPRDGLAALDKWFEREFQGNCYTPSRDWTEARVRELARL